MNSPKKKEFWLTDPTLPTTKKFLYFSYILSVANLIFVIIAFALDNKEGIKMYLVALAICIIGALIWGHFDNQEHKN